MLILLHFYQQYYLRMSVRGGKMAAFGALIRMKCVSVETMLPILTGAWITSGFTFHPTKTKGEEAYMVRTTLVSNE